MKRQGSAEEIRAANWLVSRGYTLLAQNYTIRGGEIDLILRDGDVIAFVEVKSSAVYSAPRERVTPLKQKRICRAAAMWAQTYGCPEDIYRFDVVEVLPNGMTHLKNAFEYQE